MNALLRRWRLRGTETWVEEQPTVSWLIGGPDVRWSEHWSHGRPWRRRWERVR